MAKQAKQPKTKAIPTTKAPEVEDLALELIERDHPSLRNAHIRYGFSAKKSRRFGKVVLVREEEQTLLERTVAFLIVVNKAIWDRYKDDGRRQALDELLCACSYDGMTPRLERPDFKGFRANVLRYGVTSPELADSFRGIQVVLPGLGEDEPAEEAARGVSVPVAAAICQDCGDECDSDRQGEGGVPLCEACWRFRQDSADEHRSNADDEGAHCEGCNSWGREGRLVEQPDARLLCWKCRASEQEEPAVVPGLTLVGNAPGDVSGDGLDGVPGLTFADHSPATEALDKAMAEAVGAAAQ